MAYMTVVSLQKDTSMKVALFFDGKNFYSGWRERASRQPLDFTSLSRWLVERVGGSILWGAYYYTGIESANSTMGSGQSALTSFLDNLEMLPGFFVQRFSRRTKSYHCRECNAENVFSQENQVDTTMVADMLRLAAVGAFDILILMSGDADHAPAVEGVRALGRQAYVATWGGVGLSRVIRRAAFDHIDLVEALQHCSKPIPLMEENAPLAESNDPSEEAIPLLDQVNHMVLPFESNEKVMPIGRKDVIVMPIEPLDPSDALVEEVRRAEAKFPLGYVGVNFFVNRWHANNLDPDPDFRRVLIDKMVKEERLELYTTEDGTKAIRLKRAAAMPEM